MDIKKNITLEERIQFVNVVCDMCERNGKLYYALFDYAWRVAVIMFFAPDTKLENMSADEMAEYVYSQQGVEIVEHPDIAVITAGLYEACEAEMKDRREKNMRAFNEANHPDPLDRIADAFAEIGGTLTKLSDKDFLIELVKEMQKNETAKKPIQQPVKIAVVNGSKEK